MKTPALALALFATVLLPAAETPAAPELPPAPKPKTVLTPEMAEELKGALPQYSAPPPAGAKPPEQKAEGEVIELPKVTVKPRARPRLGEVEVMGPKAFNNKLAKQNSSKFDTDFLNKFTLPSWMGGMSAAERAREDYNAAQKREFQGDIQTIAKAAEQTDPAAAKALREAAAKP